MSAIMKFSVVIVALLLIVPIYAEIYRKSLAGPPQEFSEHTLPNPAQLGSVHSSSGLIPINFEIVGDRAEWQTQLPIDSTTNFTFTLFSTINDQLKVSIAPPSAYGKLVDVEQLITMAGNNKNKVQKEAGDFGLDGLRIPATTYLVVNPEEGLWEVKVEGFQLDKSQTLKLAAQKTHAYFLLDNYSPYRTFSHLASFDLLVGNQVSLVARLIDDKDVVKTNNTRNGIPKPLLLANMEVELDVIFPDGEEQIVPMKDDGLSNDALANDGIYGASVKATVPGKYQAQVVMKGLDPLGQPFLRTTQHLVQVVEPMLSLVAAPASGELRKANDDLEISIPVTTLPQVSLGGVAATEYKTYAEVWGKDAEGKDVAIAWISGIVETKTDSTTGKTSLPLSLNLNWIALAQAQEPFELRNFYVQDVTFSIPIATAEKISIQLAPSHSLALVKDLTLRPAVTEITEQMIMGPRPAAFARNSTMATSEAAGGKLMLIHGYCSATTPWATEHFTDYVVFSDYNQGRSNDFFAKLIIELGSSYSSFSTAAHSQGGLASLHAYTFYWSGADNAPAGKRILQSVGSPYKGSSLAGTLASIGNSIGVGCGSVYDLTIEGAGLWVATIPRAAKEKVFYYTTQYKDWSWCNLAANAVLEWPNDGTAEYDYSQLEYANNMGHKKSWCHSKDMKYAPQCTDPERNAQLNANAAR